MSTPHAIRPGFFDVFLTPRAYTSALYLLASLATGITAFTFAVTGLSLSAGLAILIIGVPFLVGFLALARLLAGLELRWLRATVDPDLGDLPPVLPRQGTLLARVLTLLKDRTTWTSLLYFLALMPLGILYFTVLSTMFITSAGFLAAPLARTFADGSFTLDLPSDGLAWFATHPTQSALLCALLGLLLLPATLHLALLLGRAQAWLARTLLMGA